MAYASGAELETQLIIAERLHYVSAEQQHKLSAMLDEIQKMLVGLMKSLR